MVSDVLRPDIGLHLAVHPETGCGSQGEERDASQGTPFGKAVSPEPGLLLEEGGLLHQGTMERIQRSSICDCSETRFHTVPFVSVWGLFLLCLFLFLPK